MDNSETCQFNSRFTNNILVVGQTRCGKTTFVKNMGKNKIFGDIDYVDWISKIKLDEIRERNIRSCFN